LPAPAGPISRSTLRPDVAALRTKSACLPLSPRRAMTSSTSSLGTVGPPRSPAKSASAPRSRCGPRSRTGSRCCRPARKLEAAVRALQLDGDLDHVRRGRADHAVVGGRVQASSASWLSRSRTSWASIPPSVSGSCRFSSTIRSALRHVGFCSCTAAMARRWMRAGSNSLAGRCRSCSRDSCSTWSGTLASESRNRSLLNSSHRSSSWSRVTASCFFACRCCSVTSSDIRASTYGLGALPYLLVRLGDLGDLGLDGDPAGGEPVTQVLVDADDFPALPSGRVMHPHALGALQLLLGDPLGEVAHGLLVDPQPVPVDRAPRSRAPGRSPGRPRRP
jgi:hypothetical protein